MREIKELVEFMTEELDASEKYVMAALKHKDEMRNLHELYMTLSKEEMNHMERLHSQAIKCIERKKENGEQPAAMLSIWEWEHERLMKRAAKIKHMQDM